MNVETGRARLNALSAASLILGAAAFAGVLCILLYGAAAAGSYASLIWFACGGWILLCMGLSSTAVALGLLSRGRRRMHGTALAGIIFGGAAMLLCGLLLCLLAGALLIAVLFDPTFPFSAFPFSIGGIR